MTCDKMVVTESRTLRTLPLLLMFAVVGCGTESAPVQPDGPVPATLTWQLDPEAILPIMPQDVKVTGGGIVWVADDVKDAVIRLDVPNAQYQMFGHDDTQPLEVQQPWRLAVSPTLGVVTFDGTTRNLDLFTPGGQHIRGFKPDFAPSYLDVTSQPISLIAATRRTAADSASRLLILSVDMLGKGVDTLVAENHGPEALRALSADPSQTALSGSAEGIWVWTRAVADTAFGLSVRGPDRRLVLRSSDLDAIGILHDRAEELLWIVKPDSAGLAYAGYDVSGSGLLVGTEVFIGERTTPPEFTPYVANEGSIIGTTPNGMAGLFASYDMHVTEASDPSDW